MNSPEVIWVHGGIEYKTKLSISVTSPNPSGSVAISCVLEGRQNFDGTFKTDSCGSISGFIEESSLMLYSNNGLGSVGTKHAVELFTGLVVPGSSSQRFSVFACCRVAAISGGVNGTDNHLYVTLENYLEVRTYNLFGVVISPYSPTKKSILKLNRQS
jgi:hypothetical protein